MTLKTAAKATHLRAEFPSALGDGRPVQTNPRRCRLELSAKPKPGAIQVAFAECRLCLDAGDFKAARGWGTHNRAGRSPRVGRAT